MSTNGKLVHQKVILTDESEPNIAAKEVCQFLDDSNATLVTVSQFVSFGRLFTTVFYTPE